MSQSKKALEYLTQVVSDYAQTLAPSVRGPMLAHAQGAINQLAKDLKLDNLEEKNPEEG